MSSIAFAQLTRLKSSWETKRIILRNEMSFLINFPTQSYPKTFKLNLEAWFLVPRNSASMVQCMYERYCV